MKILFICGSLEPGRDGVGDYTRRLAGECVARGHCCVLLALHDPYLSLNTDEIQDESRAIRLPSSLPWSERLARTKSLLEEQAPDTVSWQIVPYAFHPRGFLPGALLASLPGLRGRRCHVMMHELWIGLEKGARWPDRVAGWLQRRGLLCLLEQLEPDLVHTSNATYQQALALNHWPAEILPLFGNVPVAHATVGDRNALTRWIPPTENIPALVAVTFGTLHSQWQPAATVDWLLATAKRLRRSPVLLVLGRAGAAAESLLDVFRRAGVLVVTTGELEPASLSQILAAAHCGIAPHPWALIGKSGAAAAMLEHGLPVVVPRDEWQLRGTTGADSAQSLDPLLVRLADLNPARTDAWLAAGRSPQAMLEKTADAFLAALDFPQPSP
ncbi:hypothetical protein [Oleiharenicola lentus]|uniref:hypothetical protein n=1 Tax=Oleiharenicola lentus TaxID=2508720 RepID=UPI003F6733B1